MKILFTIIIVIQIIKIYSGASGLCYEDNKGGTRVLPHKAHYSDKNTVPSCMKACSKKGYKYAGVEYSKECFCGNKLPKSQRLIAECNMDCSGDKTQKCGGANRINVYKTEGVCFVDNKDGIRVLPHKRYSNKNSVAFCKNACFKEGYKYSGVEYANECFCGNKMPKTIAPKQSDCNMDCSGDKSQKCGGGNRLNLYTSDGVCFVDNKGGKRVLPHKAHYSDKNTIAFCKKACFKKGFKYAGVEYAKECFCGNKMPKTIAPKQSDCNMNCSGDKSQKCGGGNRLNLYTSDGVCFVDNKGGKRVLPHKAHYSDKNTIAFCKKACFKKGYKYAGVEYAKECFCGNKMPKTIAPKQSDCNMKCSGDKSQKCGGGNRLNLYKAAENR